MEDELNKTIDQVKTMFTGNPQPSSDGQPVDLSQNKMFSAIMPYKTQLAIGVVVLLFLAAIYLFIVTFAAPKPYPNSAATINNR